MSPLLEEKEEWKIIGVWPKKGRGWGAGEISAIKIFWFADKRGMKDFLHTGNRGPGGSGGPPPAGKCPAPYMETLVNKQLPPGTSLKRCEAASGGPGGVVLPTTPRRPVWPGGFNESSSHIKNTLSL